MDGKVVSVLPVLWLQRCEVARESELLLGPHRRRCRSRLIHHLDGHGEAQVVDCGEHEVVEEVPLDRRLRLARYP